jgi:hypothetical protein
VADLVLHIGLPKTGTTALQRFWFPMASERGAFTYLGKRMDSRERSRPPVVEAFRAFLRDRRSGTQSPETEDLLAATASQLCDGITVVSDEILSGWPLLPNGIEPLVAVAQRSTIFPTRDGAQSNHRPRRGCPPIVEFLKELDQALPDAVNLRVILVLRNQADFFGSLYAQTAGWCKRPGLDDLRSKVETLIASDDAFLSWDNQVSELHALLGRHNVLVAFYEDGLEPITEMIASFLGVVVPHEAQNIRQVNARRVSPNSWAMRPRLSGTRLSSRASALARLLHLRPPRAIGRFVSRRMAMLDHLKERLLTRLGLLRPVEMPPDLREKIAAWSAPGNSRLQQIIGRPLPEQYATGTLR